MCAPCVLSCGTPTPRSTDCHGPRTRAHQSHRTYTRRSGFTDHTTSHKAPHHSICLSYTESELLSTSSKLHAPCLSMCLVWLPAAALRPLLLVLYPAPDLLARQRHTQPRPHLDRNTNKLYSPDHVVRNMIRIARASPVQYSCAKPPTLCGLSPRPRALLRRPQLVSLSLARSGREGHPSQPLTRWLTVRPPAQSSAGSARSLVARHIWVAARHGRREQRVRRLGEALDWQCVVLLPESLPARDAIE